MIKYNLETGENVIINKFPDGQVTVHPDVISLRDRGEILAPLRCAQDLLNIISLANNLLHKDVELYIPYLLGGRHDRAFSTTDMSYLANVVGPVLNSYNFSSVKTLCPHSDVSYNVINGLSDYYDITNLNIFKGRVDVVLSPDKGAIKRSSEVADLLDVPLYSCDKVRKGASINIEVPKELPLNANVLIHDDIGDGFGTFFVIADALDRMGFKGERHLSVVHSIQFKALCDICKRYESVLTTNSYLQIPDDNIPCNLNIKNVW